MDHGPSCNCEDCWWAHDCREVDEFGIPFIDTGAPGSALEQRGDLMTDEEREDWIAGGME